MQMGTNVLASRIEAKRMMKNSSPFGMKANNDVPLPTPAGASARASSSTDYEAFSVRPWRVLDSDVQRIGSSFGGGLVTDVGKQRLYHWYIRTAWISMPAQH